MAVAQNWQKVTYIDKDGETWVQVMRDNQDPALWQSEGTTWQVEQSPDLSADEMIEQLAGDAENGNYHGWVSVYGELYQIAKKHGGEAVAAAFIADVFNMGGLHER